MNLNIVLDDGAFEPHRAHNTDAGYDLQTPVDFTVPANGHASVDLGIHFEIPHGYYGQLFSKSGLNFKHDVVCLGGTIDESYRGSIAVKLYNFSAVDYQFCRGDKIVQMVIMPYAAPIVKLVDHLSSTDRGNSGFGSTGR